MIHTKNNRYFETIATEKRNTVQIFHQLHTLTNGSYSKLMVSCFCELNVEDEMVEESSSDLSLIDGLWKASIQSRKHFVRRRNMTTTKKSWRKQRLVDVWVQFLSCCCRRWMDARCVFNTLAACATQNLSSRLIHEWIHEWRHCDVSSVTTLIAVARYWA